MPTLKPVRWIGSSREDLQDFPAVARRNIGYALHFAQAGDKHPTAKPLQGFGSAGVLEIVEDHAGNTYRAVYTVRFAEVVYVIHAFQKKSKRFIKTPQRELDLIKARLKRAEEDYQQWRKTQEE
jgi:phage-related protein